MRASVILPDVLAISVCFFYYFHWDPTAESCRKVMINCSDIAKDFIAKLISFPSPLGRPRKRQRLVQWNVWPYVTQSASWNRMHREVAVSRWQPYGFGYIIANVLSIKDLAPLLGQKSCRNCQQLRSWLPNSIKQLNVAAGMPWKPSTTLSRARSRVLIKTLNVHSATRLIEPPTLVGMTFTFQKSFWFPRKFSCSLKLCSKSFFALSELSIWC